MTDGLDVVAFGTVFLEIVFGHVPLPGPGDEVYADEFAISCGGGAVTVATTVSSMGVRAGIASLLGDDLGTRVVEEHCRRAGVDLSCSQYLPGRVAGITVVLNFDGDRGFISYLPPRPDGEPPAAERWLEVLREYRPAWCYLHARRKIVPLMEQARAMGIRIALDVGREDIADDPDAVRASAALADVFLPNEDELLRLTRAGSLADALDDTESWCPCVVVKRGAAGATVADRTGRTDVSEGLRAVAVRDLTGAGDAFAGGLIGALVQGATMTQAAAAGNAAGSQTVGKLGAVGEVEVEGLSPAVPSLAAAVLGHAAQAGTAPDFAVRAGPVPTGPGGPDDDANEGKVPG